MSDPSSQEPKDEPDPSPLDLSDLKSFSFGTQWTDAGSKSKVERQTPSGRGPGQSRRPDRRKGGARSQPRDRRPSRETSSGYKQDKSQRERPRRGPGENQYSDRNQKGRRFDRAASKPRFERPYESPVFNVGFYPDDDGFATIIKALRANHITYELFEVARIFLEKSERYVASVTRKPAPGEKPEKVFVSLPDGMPFETEEEAIQHSVSHHISAFYDQEEVETEAPGGSFPIVNRCGITKEIIGPPNYHRYEEFLDQHYQTRISNMSFEKFKNAIVQDRDEAAVNEWLESMKKTIRYSTKPVEGEEIQTFDSLKDAVANLRANHRDRLAHSVNYARVSGVTLDKHNRAEASKAVAGELARQRRFPLETANAIRGRLRREKFSIYKRGSKGVTFICAAKRNFRKPGQIMSESLDRLIQFLESNQSIKVKQLPPAFEDWLKEKYPDSGYDEKKLFQDLHWLIADGYVSHFADDSLFVQPVLEDQSKPDRPAARPAEKKLEDKVDSKTESEEESAQEDSTAAGDPASGDREEGAREVEASESTEDAGDSKAKASEATVLEAADENEVAKPLAETSDNGSVDESNVASDTKEDSPELDSRRESESSVEESGPEDSSPVKAGSKGPEVETAEKDT